MVCVSALPFLAKCIGWAASTFIIVYNFIIYSMHTLHGRTLDMHTLPLLESVRLLVILVPHPFLVLLFESVRTLPLSAASFLLPLPD